VRGFVVNSEWNERVPVGIYQRRVNRLHVGDLIGSFPKDWIVYLFNVLR
jgi:hypothetical protein